jgi:phosphatidate cytidylyltransferase
MTPARESLGAGAPLRQRPSELALRVGSSVVMVVVALVVTYQGGWLFALLWLLAGLAVLFEWLAMARCEPARVLQVALGAILVGLAGAVLVLRLGTAAGLGIVAVAGLTAAIAGRNTRDRSWAAAGFAYAAVIVLVPPLVREQPGLGLVGILWMFAVVWASDIAAYFTGRRFGGPKLWPRVSPKKTWSGFFGGLVAGVAAGALVAVVAGRLGWTPLAGIPVVMLVSALASVLGQLGDLGESALKRRFGVKDSGHLIPGHGGVMDRLDAFWAVAALMALILAGAQGVRAGWAAGA